MIYIRIILYLIGVLLLAVGKSDWLFGYWFSGSKPWVQEVMFGAGIFVGGLFPMIDVAYTRNTVKRREEHIVRLGTAMRNYGVRDITFKLKNECGLQHYPELKIRLFIPSRTFFGLRSKVTLRMKDFQGITDAFDHANLSFRVNTSKKEAYGAVGKSYLERQIFVDENVRDAISYKLTEEQKAATHEVEFITTVPIITGTVRKRVRAVVSFDSRERLEGNRELFDVISNDFLKFAYLLWDIYKKRK